MKNVRKIKGKKTLGLYCLLTAFRYDICLQLCTILVTL